MNALLKKGYLLAVVVIVANMFIGNEMKAMNKDSGGPDTQETKDRWQFPSTNNFLKSIDINKIDNINDFQKKGKEGGNQVVPGAQPKQKFFDSLLSNLLSYENSINLIGGALFSVANNYLKLWDYNPGGYWNLRIGCLGLRSKRLLNGLLQLEVNFNLGRGAFWLFPGGYNFIKAYTTREEGRSEDYLEPLYISFLVGNNSIKNKSRGLITLIVVFLLQGFVSIPLTLHFSKFSISISLDSLIWGITGMILELKAKKRIEKEREISLDGFKKVGGNNENGEGENYD